MKEKFIETLKKFLPFAVVSAVIIGTALGVTYGTAVTVLWIILTLLEWI